MKITKEKVIYFLGLNLLPIFIVSIFSLYLYFFQAGYYGRIKLKIHFWDILIMYVIVFVLIFLASITSVLYSRLIKEKYSLWYNSLVVSIIIPIFLILIISMPFITGGEFSIPSDFIEIFFSGFFWTFVFSLIILKITDPLRKKIVW